MIQEDGAAKPIGELTYTHIDPDNNLKEGDPRAAQGRRRGIAARNAIISDATDRALGANCKNYGDHLHQQANSNVAGTALWRNYDRADRRADDGMGFDPPLWGSGYTAPYPKFCADIVDFQDLPAAAPRDGGERAWTARDAGREVRRAGQRAVQPERERGRRDAQPQLGGAGARFG